MSLKGKIFNLYFSSIFDNPIQKGAPSVHLQIENLIKVIVTGFKDIEFGNKDWATCLKSANVGYLGTNGNPELTQEHVSPCISWFLGADWINNFA